MNENGIVDLITSGYSWEQIIYKIIAWEGLDPWDLNIKVLSDSFIKYIDKLKELDFKIPAKYIIVAAVLLRMKTDHLSFIGDINEDLDLSDEEIEGNGHSKPEFELNPITVPPKRLVSRKIMISELVTSLRNVLRNEVRRKRRGENAREQIKIKEDTISQRISSLYKKISDIMKKIEEDEVKFSELVPKWERKEVVNTFLPLVYLDGNKKLDCNQEEIFDEIYIRKYGKKIN